MIFTDLDEFLIFKKKLEDTSKVFYVTRSSRPGYILYKCHRDRAYHNAKEVSEMLREPKSNRVKLPCSCPSSIIAKTEGNQVHVQMVDYHPHEVAQKFHSLSPAIRNDIKHKLASGISEQTCLAQVREEYPDFLITLQDVCNVKRLKNIDAISQHQNDKISCSLMQIANQEDIKIVNDDNEDIRIFIQTEFQRQKIKSTINSSIKFMFAIDSTHCTTRYGFFLNTLHLVVDKMQGVAVAHFVSTNEQQSTIKEFLSLLLPIIPSAQYSLVTDDYPAYLNAWVDIFGEPNHIRCFWHMKKNWKLNLNKCGITGNFVRKNI